MKIFISWSGPLAKKFAEILSSWLEDVLQGTETWMSAEDIDKGSIWFGNISETLGQTGFGILCLTQENKTAPWILFEAGALSKGLTKNRVCPLLIDLETKDLEPPLSQFNGTLPNGEDMWKLIKTINSVSEKKLPEDRVKKAFAQWWGEFDEKFKDIREHYSSPERAPERSVDDMVVEILEISRAMQRKIESYHLAGAGEVGSGLEAGISGYSGYPGYSGLSRLVSPQLASGQGLFLDPNVPVSVDLRTGAVRPAILTEAVKTGAPQSIVDQGGLSKKPSAPIGSEKPSQATAPATKPTDPKK